jgi:ABC-2 type transport system permease protein
VFFPLANLPTFLQPVSKLLPTTYIFESMRSVIATGEVNWHFLVISFGLNLLYLALALHWFVGSFKASLKLGLGRFNS